MFTMFRAGYQNADIVIAVQFFINTVKIISCYMDSCNRSYEVIHGHEAKFRRLYEAAGMCG